MNEFTFGDKVRYIGTTLELLFEKDHYIIEEFRDNLIGLEGLEGAFFTQENFERINFRIGDNVVCIKSQGYNNLPKIDEEFIITSLDEKQIGFVSDYMKEVDKEISEGRKPYFPVSWFKLKKKEEKNNFKVGDEILSNTYREKLIVTCVDGDKVGFVSEYPLSCQMKPEQNEEFLDKVRSGKIAYWEYDLFHTLEKEIITVNPFKVGDRVRCVDCHTGKRKISKNVYIVDWVKDGLVSIKQGEGCSITGHERYVLAESDGGLLNESV